MPGRNGASLRGSVRSPAAVGAPLSVLMATVTRVTTSDACDDSPPEERVSWEELTALTCARQFAEPDRTLDAGSDPASDPVADLLDRIGPIQSQTARSTFVGLAARQPGLSHDQVEAAFEGFRIVRGSTLRGTVHTATPAQHVVLDQVTRLGQRALWRRTLRLRRHELEDVWSALEEAARHDWLTPEALTDALRDWLHGAGEDPSVLDGQSRYFAFGHGGLLRRPLTGAWSGQGAAGYRTAAAVVERGPAPGDPAVAAVRLHLRTHGPASRHDLAWWSGLGLRAVDAALSDLGREQALWRAVGPDDRTYVDLPGAPAPVQERGVRLLPEFDAILCGYDPAARGRFVSPDHHALLWSRRNGLILPPVLIDGRVGGYWRLEGSGRRRRLEVHCFGRRPRRSDVAQPAGALASALALELTGVTITRA